MANPRQRKKSRSSAHKPVHSRNPKKSLRKKPAIRGPKALQEAWDKHKTVRQNYALLGLVCDLNPLASGGAETKPQAASALSAAAADADADVHMEVEVEAPAAGPSQPAAIPKGYGKIIRDAAGNVLRVELSEAVDDHEPVQDPDPNRARARQAAENDKEEMRDPEMDSRVRAHWVTELGGGVKGGAALERLATGTPSSGPRHSSSLETNYLQRLVSKHQADVDAMARDRRFNPEQRTVGQLRRGLKKAGLLAL
ncbi:hypothetical protein FIBSPDRAFT_858184 [Athelia psychrophila]|uniref:Nucleolar protein 16 n=1 Tax=Athelia psychrophila TaxID=1759441 RepID=A0A166M493_9AGAM|nr:hypothetical protein FIBSPDRAFT_858184 [Fibularhizoctonia sp. CBS 109695]